MDMTTTINKNRKLIIDSNIIDSFGLKAGQEVKIILEKNKIEILPIRRKKSLHGFLKGMDNHFEREKDRI
jgi:bifunctional DNA-binding transcriptional regulator/antitoxin component of YhaV-PrlF toxin-antitoxin module